jgi:hypothetical protein
MVVTKSRKSKSLKSKKFRNKKTKKVAKMRGGGEDFIDFSTGAFSFKNPLHTNAANLKNRIKKIPSNVKQVELRTKFKRPGFGGFGKSGIRMVKMPPNTNYTNPDEKIAAPSISVNNQPNTIIKISPNYSRYTGRVRPNRNLMKAINTGSNISGIPKHVLEFKTGKFAFNQDKLVSKAK